MKIIYVCDTSSIHAAKWVRQFAGCGWEIEAFQSRTPDWSVYPEFPDVRLHIHYPVPVPPGTKCRYTLRHALGPIAARLLGNVAARRALRRQHARYLADLINETKPDAVHVLGLGVHWRNMAEPILDAFDSGLRMPCPLVYSSWGTDLECFARLPEQTADVRRFLERVDVHVPECARDARLARELGFKGRTWMSLPAFGGVDLQRAEGLMMPRDLVDRRTVILKGRDHTGEYGDPIGRAMTAVQAFDVCVDALRGYRIVVVQANRSVAEACNTLRLKTGLDVQVWPRVAYEELMRCFGQARAVISLTVNDGLPGILVEAMTAGALPLHSELEPIREWIVHGENGLLVPPDDVGAAAAALRRALTDDELVRRAAERNREIVRTRLDAGIVRQRAIEMYEKVANRGVQTAVYGTSQFGVQGV